MKAHDHKHSLLVLDDEEVFLRGLDKLFSSEYKVYTAQTTATAEKILDQYPIDLILCDDQMPEETGLMFLARIRDRHPNLKRILFSGYVDKEMLAYAVNHADVMRVIEKPFDAPELLKMVERSLQNQPEPVVAPPEFLPGLLRQAVSVTVFCSSAMFSLILLGSIGIAFLYFLKTVLGINFFEDMHFRDFFPG